MLTGLVPFASESYQAMFDRRQRFGWRHVRATLVVALVLALTVGGVPVRACGCAGAGVICACSNHIDEADAAGNRQTAARSTNAASQTRSCCRPGHPCARGCCAHRPIERAAASPSQGTIAKAGVKLAARHVARSVAGDRFGAGRCSCQRNLDRELPKQAPSPRTAVADAVGPALGMTLFVAPLNVSDRSSCHAWQLVRSPFSDRVIALCRLVI